MIPEKELEFLRQENDVLFTQLEEANALLLQKEEEIALLKNSDPQVAELQSKLDAQLDQLHQMQNIIGKKQQQAEGAEERELELNNELTIAYSLQQKYDELLTEHIHAQTQLQDLQEKFAEIENKNEALQQKAAKTVELESRLENADIEAAALRDTIELLKKQGNR